MYPMQNIFLFQKMFIVTLLGIGMCICTSSDLRADLAKSEILEKTVSELPEATLERWESTYLFEKTGLLAHPGETAVEILVRAHKREPDAMFLAATGYTWGICGFPKDTILAGSWSNILNLYGKYAASSHVNVQIWKARQLYTEINIGVILADCKIAAESPYTDLLEKAEQFKLNGLCTAAEEFKLDFPGWEEYYKNRLRIQKEAKNEVQIAAGLMRELRSRPATLLEQDAINRLTWRDGWSDAALFFAATTHDLEGGTPDWSNERLLAFVTAQRKQLQKENQAGKREMRTLFLQLVHEAGDALARRVTANADDSAELIRKAHWGDIPSIYNMVEHYANGTSGFIKSRELSEFWLQHAALYTDKKAAWALAVSLFARGELSLSWAWGAILLEFFEPDEVTRASAQAMLAEIESLQGERQAEERKHLKNTLIDKSVNLTDWRFGSNKISKTP